jgi:outer membrane protein OmpA-like peptidoglycan-associated protein
VKNLTPRLWLHGSRLLVLFTICLAPLANLSGQVKSGFDYLEQKNYAAARTAFEQALQSPDDKLPATWGLSRVFAASDNPEANLDSAYVLGSQTTTMLRGVKNKRDKKRLEKRYQLNSSEVTKLQKDLPKRRWDQINGKGNLRDLDRYIRVFSKRYPAGVKPQLMAQRKEAMLKAITNAHTYDDMAYLYQTYNKLLQDSFAKGYQKISEGLFDAFLITKDYDPKSVEDFMTAHPMHPVSSAQSNAYRDFVAARTSGTATSWIKMVTDMPESPFVPIGLRQAQKLTAVKPMTAEEESRLTPDQKILLEDIKTGDVALAVVNCSSKFAGKNADRWKRYMNSHAGDDCGKRALREMVQFYMQERNWEQMSAVLNESGALFPSDSSYIRRMKAISNAPSTGVKPVKLNNQVNTAGSESFPVLTPDGQTLAFCGRNRKDNIGGEDIYFSEWNGTDWGPAKPVKELCGSSNDAVNCFIDDGNTAILFGGSTVYVSTKTATGWTPKKTFQMDLSPFTYIGDLIISPGGNQAIIAATGGGGGTNLYISLKDESGKWSKPQKLPGSINSEKDERSPCLHPDMQTMYFSSDRSDGFGSYDVYRTVRLDDTWLNWSDPVNLGKDINTPDADWGYFINNEGTRAYFSSGVFGSADIYYIDLPKEYRPQKEVRSVKVLVVDEKGKTLTDIPLEVRNSMTAAVVADTRTPPRAGTVSVVLPAGDRVTFAVKKTGLYADPVALDLGLPLPDSLKTKPLRIIARKVDELAGQKTILSSDILFDTGKSELKPEANGQIRILADFAKRENRTLILGGHTDPTGSDAENQTLSEKRAEAVKQALIDAGVPAEKMTAQGFGETQLICKEANPDCYLRNRRVEIKW